ncbi:hypothetical protein FHS61_002900 [Altererythrobacter atlanticus]|uniref:Uncharacterized protein n=1 Tax=Croceibacterium atlanticum TaxID=1267766 RepID=A0A0F7KWR4_9SPHN|nr:DUF2975 domain-containing protein [Croceibacterium atlanticum]AKH43662.1 hypothetical protein WYH_02632 [Croceibacterium atlanticum]MBB5733854.1 hypothetical protein [Croceibacterium atlanticum]
MTQIKRDKLLIAARILVIFLKAVLGIAALGVVVAIPVVLFSQSHVADALVSGVSLASGLSAIVATLLLGMVLLGGAFWFVHLLGRMIDTVGEGNPFVPDNADRLSRMGWIAVALQVAQIPLTVCASMVDQYFPEANVNIDSGISLTGIALAIVLFILARVFREGTAMREDLEGTV